MKQNKTKRRTAGGVFDLLWIALLAVFAFYVNRDIVIKGLYMDDLYMWSCYGEQPLLEFAFPIGTSTRFRPVYWLATYLQMAIVGNHISWFVPFNILCNLAVAASVYYIIKKLSRYRFLGFLGGVCYLVSRFAYYQIGQALGLMETMALFMAVWILYLLYRYVNAPHERTRAELLSEEEQRQRAGCDGSKQGGRQKGGLKIRLVKSGDWRFGLSLFLYFLLVFTHERYLALLPLFYLALLFRLLRENRPYRGAFLRENRRLFLAPLLLFLLIFLIRTLAIGTAIPAGTGGTEVTETFHVSEAVGYALSQVLYMFGVNAGPEHLCGLPWKETPLMIKTLTKLGCLFLFVICAMFALTELLNLCSKKPSDRTRFFCALQNSFLFAAFIALCIGCSSVTIRVEMRWIYVSYTAALLFCTWMIGEIVDNYRKSADDGGKTGEVSDNVFSRAGNGTADRILTPGVVAGLLCAVFLGYTLLSAATNLFYRQYFPKLYFWADQLRMNSLAEETWEKYGTELFGKHIYILGNSYGMSDFYKDTFFKTFDPDKKAEGTEVSFAKTEADIPKDVLRSGNLIVLEEVPEENAYRDVTEEILKKAGREQGNGEKTDGS